MSAGVKYGSRSFPVILPKVEDWKNCLNTYGREFAG